MRVNCISVIRNNGARNNTLSLNPTKHVSFFFFFFFFHLHTAIDILGYYLVSPVFINYFVSIIFNCAGFNVSDFIDWNIKNPGDWKKRDCFLRRGNVTFGEEGRGKSEVIRAIEEREKEEGM